MPNTSITFPASPAVNQQYTYGTTTYVWTGTSWMTYIDSASLMPTNPAAMTRQQFSGTGSQTVFTLAADPGALGNGTHIYINGVYQQKATYTTVTTTLTFSSAPPLGTNNIEVVSFVLSSVGTTDSALVTYLPSGTGAVTRTAQSKMRDTVSVKDFGAVGDGVADDTAALVNAYAAAKANNCTLHIPVGTFKFTSQLNWNQGVDVYGSHNEYCVLLKNGNFDGIKISGTGAVYSGFYIRGDTGNNGCGIVIGTTNYVDINNITVRYHGSHGINYNYSIGNDNAISFVTLRRSLIANNTGDGIRLDGTSANYPTSYCNVCSFYDVTLSSNTGIGFNQTGNNNSGYHVGENIVTQNNIGGGMFICGIQNNFTVYLESNTSFDLKLETTSIRNYLNCLHTSITTFDYGTNNSVKENIFLQVPYITPLPKYTIASNGSDQYVGGGHSCTTGNFNGGDLILFGGNKSGTGITGSVYIETGKLKFPSTQVSSTQVNTLDDYKEGTWVPVMTSAGATFTAVSNGSYQKMGKQVTVWGYVDTSSVATGTLTNTFSIAGLPYTSNNLGYGYPATIANIINVDWIVGALQIVGIVPTSSTEIILSWATATGVTQFLASAVDSSDTRINFSATYQTTT